MKKVKLEGVEKGGNQSGMVQDIFVGSKSVVEKGKVKEDENRKKNTKREKVQLGGLQGSEHKVSPKEKEWLYKDKNEPRASKVPHLV